MEGEISANHSAYWPHARDLRPPRRLKHFENVWPPETPPFVLPQTIQSTTNQPEFPFKSSTKHLTQAPICLVGYTMRFGLIWQNVQRRKTKQLGKRCQSLSFSSKHSMHGVWRFKVVSIVCLRSRRPSARVLRPHLGDKYAFWGLILILRYAKGQ